MSKHGNRQNVLSYSITETQIKIVFVFRNWKYLACFSNWDVSSTLTTPLHIVWNFLPLFPPEDGAFKTSTEILSLFLSALILCLHDSNWFKSSTACWCAGWCQSYRVDVISKVLKWNWIHWDFIRIFHYLTCLPIARDRKTSWNNCSMNFYWIS